MTQVESETGNSGVGVDQRVLHRRNHSVSLAKNRITSVLVYSTATLLLAIGGSIGFNVIERDTEFAISIIGSLVGGFLGALLASALIIDTVSRLDDRNRD